MKNAAGSNKFFPDKRREPLLRGECSPLWSRAVRAPPTLEARLAGMCVKCIV
jgi:hypothetical protein